MDKDQYDRLKNTCDGLDEKLEAITVILSGKMDGTKGLVSVLQDLVKVIHDENAGALKRLERLENERTWIKGYLACAVAAGGLIVFLVEHWK